MHICMAGLDHESTGLEQREKLSFTRAAAAEKMREIIKSENIIGCVLISTCNRTELYLSCDGEADPAALLGDSSLTVCRDEDCARHLMEVSCGLRSMIVGEDQILSQVRDAAALAREAGTMDPMLESLFRTAVSCGKAAKANLKLRGVSGSAAESALRKLEEYFISLQGKNALVIGNGEMGRLAAGLLRDRGCCVTVTLRSYRHGQTIVPPGCATVAYDDRYSAMEMADLVVSATTSPHYTVRSECFVALYRRPAALVDLALPRDIEPGVGELAALWNIDDLAANEPLDDRDKAMELVDEYLERFYRWCNYRECLPAMEELRRAVTERVRRHGDDSAEEGANRAIDLIMGEFSQLLSPEKLREAAQNIRERTR